MNNIIPIRRGLEAPGDSGPGASSPEQMSHSRPATDWLELCRKEFCRRYYAESGDLIDDCKEVYR